MPPELLRSWGGGGGGGGGGYKNGVNIVELWSKDYIHVDKLWHFHTFTPLQI